MDIYVGRCQNAGKALSDTGIIIAVFYSFKTDCTWKVCCVFFV